MRNSWKVWLAATLLALLSGSTAMAASTFDVAGIKVSLSGPGNAYYDGEDGTLTVQTEFDWCSVRIAATPLAADVWGGYADVFLWADEVSLRSVTMKGTTDTWLYAVGQMDYCQSFRGVYANSGYTDAYGPDVGLGMTTAQPNVWAITHVISLRFGVCFAGLCGNDYSAELFGKSAKTLDQILPAEGRRLLLGR
jgi:hypothetical protein